MWRHYRLSAIVVFIFLLVCVSTPAEEVRVAVAANFLKPMEEIATTFKAETSHTLRISAGSSGQFYAQIRNGAPLDVFFSADQERPKRLEQEGLAVSGTRFTYAVGRLVLWSAEPELIRGDGRELLRAGKFKYLAIANPEVAPYGAAARQVLQTLKAWDALQPRLVQGQDIGQTYQFIATRNAELGFVSLSQVQRPGQAASGSRWVVPVELYDPVRQDAVLLKTGAKNRAAHALLDFARGTRGRRLIESWGYSIAPEK